MKRLHHFIVLSVCLGLLLILSVACAGTAGTTPPASEPANAPSNSITNIVRQWTSVKHHPTNETTEVANPEAYTITFREDGTLSGQADCNTFTGTYTIDDGFFIASTPDVMVACGGDSLDIQYFELLDAVVARGPDGSGGLALETAGSEQRMLFENGGAAPAP
jgi:heat shock protein HslJ